MITCLSTKVCFSYCHRIGPNMDTYQISVKLIFCFAIVALSIIFVTSSSWGLSKLRSHWVLATRERPLRSNFFQLHGTYNNARSWVDSAVISGDSPETMKIYKVPGMNNLTRNRALWKSQMVESITSETENSVTMRNNYDNISISRSHINWPKARTRSNLSAYM